MDEIGRFLIFLEAKSNGHIRGRGGEALHYLVFKMLSSSSEDYANHIHQITEKPFAISPMIIAEGEKNVLVSDGFMDIKRGDIYCIIVRCLSGEFISRFRDASQEFTGRSVILSRIHFDIIDVKEEEMTSYSELLNQRYLPHNAEMDILTPLSFRSGGVQILFPLPELIIKSVLSIWNNFASTRIPQNLTDCAKDIRVSGYELRTEMIKFSDYNIFGCRGRISFDLRLIKEEEHLNYLKTLLLYSNYSGIGYKRTMGMGMVNTSLH